MRLRLRTLEKERITITGKYSGPVKARYLGIQRIRFEDSRSSTTPALDLKPFAPRPASFAVFRCTEGPATPVSRVRSSA
jgi:hypothetical protein